MKNVRDRQDRARHLCCATKFLWEFGALNTNALNGGARALVTSFPPDVAGRCRPDHAEQA